jgi:DNA-binding response OmpR family regulator
MSDGSGYDFIRAVKADTRLARIPFIFITSAMLEERDRARGLSMGAARFLVRPIEPQQLLTEIEACLREAKIAGRMKDVDPTISGHKDRPAALQRPNRQYKSFRVR